MRPDINIHNAPKLRRQALRVLTSDDLRSVVAGTGRTDQALA
jgi:hypothetical protein